MANTESKAELEANFETLADPNRGRLVAVGLSEDGRSWRLITGMGGRSAGSKNRYYKLVEDLNKNGPYIRTEVHDPSIQKGDPTTTLYTAHRNWGNWHVASNGEQTEGLSFALALGCDFREAQEQYKNEGLKADYTARITAAVCIDENYAAMGKIVRMRNPKLYSESEYHVYNLGPGPSLILNPGEGYIIYTYDGKGGTDPDYYHPRRIPLRGSLEEAVDLIWNTWDPNTKAGLVGKEVEKWSGRFRYSFKSIHEGRA